jgi:tetratricopeptide (TPR) repeat protein
VAELAALRAAQAGAAAGVEELRRAGLDLSAPANGPALQRLVELLVADGKTQEASDAVKAALAAHPDEALFRELRGRALRAAGDADGSRGALEGALEIEPNRTSALVELAALSAEQGDPEAAISLYDRATGIEPASAEPAWAAIQLVAQDGDAAGLERRLEALLVAHPSHAGAAKLLAQRLQGRDPERALELARRAVRFGGGPEARDTLARIEALRPSATRSAQTRTSD